MKLNLRFTVACLCVLAVSAIPIIAQTAASGSAITVDQSVPFGTISGKLLLLGTYLVFVDDQQPNASFVVAKSTIETLKADGPEITVQTREAIRNRSGDVSRLSFRVAPGADPAVVTSWYGNGAAIATAGTSASAPAGTPGKPAVNAMTYQVRHTHLIGDCSGRLIVGPTQLSYESVSTVGHSRRWEYESIKETHLSNPYELEIKPFTGEAYKLHFDGTGIDPAAYKDLVDRITNARAGH